MKTSIRFRLSFSHLLVLLIGILIAGALAWLTVEEIYLTAQRENLLAQARLTAAILEGDLPQTFAPDQYSQTTNVTPGIHTRLLDEGGGVLIDVPFPEGENPVRIPPSEDPGFVPASELVIREEIQSALAGNASTAIRTIEALDGKRVLYAAAPVINDSNQVSSLVYLATPLPARRLPGGQTTRLVSAIALAGILASVIGLILARRIARPLEDLDRAASAVSEGNLNPDIQSDSSVQEINNLGQTFMSMTDNLRQAEETKNAFITDVTHELRTPLTVIKGTVETLEEGAVDDIPNRERLLTSMGRETNRMIRLVNDLLILTRSDANALALDTKTYDLGNLIQDRCENFMPLAIQNGVTFNFDLDSSQSHFALGDQSRTSQVLDNLLDNALRYAPPGSVITISLKEIDNQVQCSVIDQGPGVPPDQLELIFERFYRVDKSRDRVSGGSGLGLAIARSLIKAQGGAIQAENHPGEGAIFMFSLPKPD
jgi:signal transduction histidine kinase